MGDRPRTAVWEGFEYDRVRGPYAKKKRGVVAAWQLNLYRTGEKRFKTITRKSEAIILSLEARLREQIGSDDTPPKLGRPTGSRGTKKAPDVPVPRASETDAPPGELDYDAEVRVLAAALRDATTAEQVDVVKRKSDALKSLRQLQASSPKKDKGDPTKKMSFLDCLEAAVEHLRRHGYEVKRAAAQGDTEASPPGGPVDKQGVREGSEGAAGPAD